MAKPARLAKLLGFALLTLIVYSTTLSAHAVSMYVPGVTAGNLAQYRVLYDSCQSSVPSGCQTMGNDLNDSQYSALDVLGVSGPTISLQLITIYKNGTGSSQGATVNVDTGASNITSIGPGAPGDYFAVAKDLQASDHIWNNPSSPTFNTTNPETIFGAMRTINFLNFSSSFNIMGSGFSSKTGFAYDQATGLFVEISFSYTSTGVLGDTTQKFAIGMVDNSIWGTAVLPDFDLSAYPTSISVTGSSSGISTITLTRSSGFSASVKLTANSPSSGLTCLLSSNTLAFGGSDTSTLSCSGAPGTYTVAIEGNSGYSLHSTLVTINIVSAPDFRVTSSGPISFQTGSSGRATITLTAQNGYSSTTTLEVTSTPSGLTCNLSGSSVNGGGSVTLTCSGQPGTYTVTVKATGGGTTHSTPTSVTVSSASVSTQPASPLPVLLIARGVVAALVVLVVALLLLRRRPKAPVLASGNPTSA